MSEDISLNVNGIEHQVQVETYDTLTRVLREKLGLTGTKRGCDTGGCGACTVIMDGRAIYSCMMPAQKAARSRITTIEGLSRDGDLHPVQRAFIEHGALQCGYCTPGMIMSVVALRNSKKTPEETEIREAMAGNLCRCTGYGKIVDAALASRRK